MTLKRLSEKINTDHGRKTITIDFIYEYNEKKSLIDIANGAAYSDFPHRNDSNDSDTISHGRLVALSTLACSEYHKAGVETDAHGNWACRLTSDWSLWQLLMCLWNSRLASYLCFFSQRYFLPGSKTKVHFIHKYLPSFSLEYRSLIIQLLLLLTFSGQTHLL